MLLNSGGDCFLLPAPYSRECVPTGMGWARSRVFQDIALAGISSYGIHSLYFTQQPPLELERFSLPSHRTVTPSKSPQESYSWAGRKGTGWFSNEAMPSLGYGPLYEIQIHAQRPRVHCKLFQWKNRPRIQRMKRDLTCRQEVFFL